jgi:subtilisin family serine protease
MTFQLRAAALLAVLLPFAAVAAKPDANRYIVKFQPGKAAAARAALANAGGRVALELPDAVAVTLPTRAVSALSRNPNVAYVEPDAVRYPLALVTPSAAPYQTGQLVPYGIKNVQADQLTDVDTSNREVCIIDSGIDAQHEDLAGNTMSGVYDGGTGNWFTDENHHGTHVAGTVAAIDNGRGVVGVNARTRLKLHIVKVFGADGWAYSSTLASAANQCQTYGANIISMSLGGSVRSKFEETAFNKLYNAGILSIAAAGNDGSSRQSFPASYASVVSVAAVNESNAWATFSQYNKQVELSGPGVSVLSTVPMGTGEQASLTVGGTAFAPIALEGSFRASAGGTLADFGQGLSASAGSMTGKVCLIQRGTNAFSDKVLNCQASGGVGAVVYNNVAGPLSGTLGGDATSIPSVGVSDTEGAQLKTRFGQSATVGVQASSYAYFDGTSMATPHVSAVAALVWSKNTNCSAAQIRDLLRKSAKDIGTSGYDTRTGYGLVQAKTARDRLSATGNCSY